MIIPGGDLGEVASVSDHCTHDPDSIFGSMILMEGKVKFP